MGKYLRLAADCPQALTGSLLFRFELRHPDVARPLAHIDDDLVPRHRHFELAQTEVHQRPPSLVSMEYGNRGTGGEFRRRVQPLRPDAAESVPYGNEIEDV